MPHHECSITIPADDAFRQVVVDSLSQKSIAFNETSLVHLQESEGLPATVLGYVFSFQTAAILAAVLNGLSPSFVAYIQKSRSITIKNGDIEVTVSDKKYLTDAISQVNAISSPKPRTKKKTPKKSKK